MKPDFERLARDARSQHEKDRRAVVTGLADSRDEKSREILELLATDKAVGVRVYAASLLKKNFSAGASSDGGASSGILAASASEPAWLERWAVVRDPEFVWRGWAPLAILILCGLFSPPIGATPFLFGFFAAILLVATHFESQIAIPWTGFVTLLSVMAHSMGIMLAFRPTFPVVVIYVATGVAASSALQILRSELAIQKANSDLQRTNVMQLKKLVEKKRDPADIERDMSEIDRMKRDLKEKSRKTREVISQINQLISEGSTSAICERVGKTLTGQLGAESCSVWLIDTRAHALYPIYYTVDAERKTKMAVTIPTTDDRLIARVAREGGLIARAEVEALPEYAEYVFEDGLVATSIAIALEVAEANGAMRVLGVINVPAFKPGGEVTSEDYELMRAIGRTAANALKWSGDLELAKTDLQNTQKVSEQEREEKKKIRLMFRKFVAGAVVDELLKSPDRVNLGGVKQKITVFFADIRGFTKMSEELSDRPEEVIEIVNLYLSTMTGIIINKGGTLDKYMGDALMALFGAPISRSDDAYRAVAAGMEIRHATEKIRQTLLAKRKVGPQVGIGINTGVAVVGMVGSESIMNYTAIGDAVNTAARLESNAKGGQLLISASTLEDVGAFLKTNGYEVDTCLEYDTLEPIQVKGKKQLVQIYDVNDVKDIFLL